MSKKVLVTGGTVFVSRYIAEYYVQKGYDVYVLNRNTKKQSKGVHLIECDRHNLGQQLKNTYFDMVLDVTAYTKEDISEFVKALGEFGEYVMISSSAVYPETEVQPFKEETPLAENKFWGVYGTDKIEAEKELLKLVPNAYILRPPYLYGAMNNVYREAFVFDCATNNRKFYLPKDGSMKLQFFHVSDLCRFIDKIIEQKPKNHIFNVGNKDTVSIKEWVEACYKVAGKTPEFVNVYGDIDQRNYFSFYNYEYYLDVTKQCEILTKVISMDEGLKEAYKWYVSNQSEVRIKPFIEYIENNLIKF